MTSAELPVWAVAPGVPSGHVARAALHAAAVIDEPGSAVPDVRKSYWHRATGGYFNEADLRRGERLLIDCGLVAERDGRLIPTPDLEFILEGTLDGALETLASKALLASPPPWILEEAPPVEALDALAALVPDSSEREELLLALGRTFDDAHQRLLGAIGEEVVVTAARRELEQLGYPDLARSVRRVSLTSDQLGYDVVAPTVGGRRRLLEVKSTTQDAEFRIHLSRNEAKVGAHYPDEWRLVLCRVTDAQRREGEIVGWCDRAALEPFLPADVPGGRWQDVLIALPRAILTPHLPRAVD